MTSSTPDALWRAPPLRLLRPAGIAWRDLHRGRLLSGCSLEVPVGVRLLVAGVPPASASLLLRILAGLARPRRGRVEIAGLSDPSPEGWARRVAYVGPEPGIRAWMTPRESMRLTAELLGLTGALLEHRLAEAVAWAGIPASAMDRSIRHRGQEVAQRTAMACALLGDPEVLLLDDPLRAVHPVERQRILAVPGARRTVLIAGRSTSVEPGLVTHAVLLRHGRTALYTPVDELEAAGLPLSAAGLVALAEQRADRAEPAAMPSRPGTSAAR